MSKKIQKLSESPINLVVITKNICKLGKTIKYNCLSGNRKKFIVTKSNWDLFC